MIRLELKNNIIKVLEREALTEGQVNSVPVSFTFSSEWEGLLRIAVFTTGNITRCVILDDTNKCFVPPEVTSHAGDAVFVGVHGTQSDGTVVLPSTNARLEYVRESANPEKDTGSKSLSLWQQVLLELDNVSKIADESSAEIDDMHSEIENIYTKTETDDKIKSDIASVIVQDVGEDATKVMSQKALTELLHVIVDGINEFGEFINQKADANSVYTKGETYSKGETDAKIQANEDELRHSFTVISHENFMTLKGYIDEVDGKIGDIDSALDELHSYAQALISGGEA